MIDGNNYLTDVKDGIRTREARNIFYSFDYYSLNITPRQRIKSSQKEEPDNE